MEDLSTQSLVASITIYSSAAIGIILSFLNLRTVSRIPKISSKGKMDKGATLVSGIMKDDVEYNEDGEPLIGEKKKSSFHPANELQFFYRMGFYFVKENAYFYLLFFIFLPIITALCYYYLHYSFTFCFVIGYAEFILNFWLSRKIFIKVMLRLQLTGDSLHFKHINWKLFNKFLFSAFLCLDLSTVLISVYSIYLLYKYYFLPQDENAKGILANNSTLNQFYELKTNFGSFVVYLAFYLLGKNMLLILNNMWYSYHLNRKTLRYLRVDSSYFNKLAAQSYGFYYNTLSKIHKHNVVTTEIIVLSTICLAEYKTNIVEFFLFFAAVLLLYLLLTNSVSIYLYDFRNIKEFLNGNDVSRIAFSYFFFISLMFIFYHYFISPGITVLKRKNLTLDASFNYLYVLCFTLFLLQKFFEFYFETSYKTKKQKQYIHSERFTFSINNKLFLRIFVSLILLFVVFIVFGFLGVVFTFFYLSMMQIFYKIKKLSLVFNSYIKTLLHFCQVTEIYHINFNKLLNVIDKTYIYSFFLMLFCLPLYRLANLKYFISDGSKQKSSNDFDNFLGKLFIILITYGCSMFALIIYTRLVYRSFKKSIERERYAISKTKKIMDLIKQRHIFFIVAGLIFISFIYLFYYYLMHSYVLSVIIGIAIHIFQLVYTNKVRIRKYTQTPFIPKFTLDYYRAIDEELSRSPTYLKSLCELSFANVLLEIDKLFLLTFFIFNFVKPPGESAIN